MTEKFLLAEGEFFANNKDFMQKYFIEFLPKVLENDKVIYTDKVSLSIITDRQASLRMITSGQVRILIIDLFKAYFKMRQIEGLPLDIVYIQYDFNNKMREIHKKIQEGEI